MRKGKKTDSCAILQWKLLDYKKNNEEAPVRIINNPSKTEGELMRDDEIEDWFVGSIRTLEVLKEEDTTVFKRIHRGFISDLEYLLSLGKIDKDIVVFAKSIKNFDFDKEKK